MSPPADLYLYKAVIRSIYDGDTLRCDIALGFDIWKNNVPIRLYGINAPEIRGNQRPKGLISRNWLREQLPTGSEFLLRSHLDKRGKYGRILGEIYLPEDCMSLNAKMVLLGYAKFKDYR